MMANCRREIFSMTDVYKLEHENIFSHGAIQEKLRLGGFNSLGFSNGVHTYGCTQRKHKTHF